GLDVFVVPRRMIELELEVEQAQGLAALGERMQQAMQEAFEAEQQARVIGIGGLELELAGDRVFERPWLERGPVVRGGVVQARGGLPEACPELGDGEPQELPERDDAEHRQLVAQLRIDAELGERDLGAPATFGVGIRQDPCERARTVARTDAAPRERVAAEAVEP